MNWPIAPHIKSLHVKIFRIKISRIGNIVLRAALLALLLSSMAPGLAEMAQVAGPVVGSDTGTIQNPELYGKPNQSRLWYNSYQQRWDAIVPKASNDGTSDHYLLLDVPGAQTFTGVELDDRDDARPDAFWDDGNRMLYVLSSHAAQTEFWRLSYDPVGDSYAMQVGAPGAGVVIPGLAQPGGYLGGNSPAALYVSPNGRIWASVMKAGGLLVQQSTDGGSTWLPAPVNLNSGAHVGVTVWTEFQQGGVTYLGLFAGENGEEGAPTRFYFWTIPQDADPTDPASWNDESASIPGPVGVEQSDDHVSSARDGDGNMYFAVKTESGNPTDPLLRLFKRTPDGVWSAFTVTEAQETPEHSRPSLVVDNEHRTLTVYMNEAEVVGDSVRRAGRKGPVSLDALQDLASMPVVYLFDKPGTVFTDIITPRFSVNSDTDVVVLVHNRTDAQVWHLQESYEFVYLPLIFNNANH